MVFKYRDVSQSERRNVESRKKKSQGGSKGAEKKWKPHREVLKLVQILSRRTDELDDPIPPKELWPELYSQLDLAGLNPREFGNPKRPTDPTNPSRYQY